MPRAIISFSSFSELYWSLFIAFLIASMHMHAQEICYYDDLLCFFSPFLHKLFCDRRAYVYTRPRQWQASSNHVCICPWERMKKCMWVLSISCIIFRYVIVVHRFFSSARQLKEIGFGIVFSYSCKLGKKKTTETFIDECLSCLLTPVGLGHIHSSKWNRNQPMNNLIERHTSRQRKKKM